MRLLVDCQSSHGCVYVRADGDDGYDGHKMIIVVNISYVLVTTSYC